MPVWLVDEEHSQVVEIPLKQHEREALEIQWSRIVTEKDRHDFDRRVALAGVDAIQAALDYELRRPTKSQIAFATAIGRRLGVAVPSEAFLYRGCMSEFLDRYGEFLRRS